MRMWSRLSGALASGALLAVPVLALLLAEPAVVRSQSQTQCITGAAGLGPSGCYGVGVTLMNPDGTSASLGGGGGGGAVYGLTLPGAAPVGNGLKPFLNGFVGADGNVRQVSPTDPLPTGSLPTGLTSTPVSASITTGGTFQSLTPASATRKGCTAQYRSTSIGYVAFAASAPASITSPGVIQLGPGQTVSCAIGGNSVATDQIWVTGATSDLFSGNIQ